MTLHSHSWAYIQRKTWERIHAIAKIWKQPVSIEKWIQKMWDMYTMEIYITQPLKRVKYAICSNMHGPRDCHTE